MLNVLDKVTVFAPNQMPNEDPAGHDIETAETLPPDVIAIERWLTEGGRVLPDEFDQ